MKKGACMGPDAMWGSEEYWKEKRILIVSPEAWGPVRLSKHHYASTLMEQGARIFFLGPDSAEESGVRMVEQAPGRPSLLYRPPPLRGMRFLPAALRRWAEARQMEQLARTAGGAFDVLWNFDLYRFRWITDRSNAVQRILHVMDLRKPADLQGPAGRADLVVVVSPSMAGGTGKWRERVLHLGHGWMPRGQNPAEPPDLAVGIRVGYLGNLAMRAIDWGSILAIASDFPEVRFHLMGPAHGTSGDVTRLDPVMENRLRARPNIDLIGAVPYDKVPAWLEAMDILLIAYDLERVGLKATSSHKLLEYLASGKVVVSSYLEDHDDLEDLMVMAKPGATIVPLFREVLHDLDRLNAAEIQARRKAYAARNSYPVKVAQVAQRLARW